MQRGSVTRHRPAGDVVRADRTVWAAAAGRAPGAQAALAALAVLLILGGALGAGFLVLQSGKRVAAIEISQPVGAGQQIPLSAMQEVQIASGTGLSYVPWNEASQVAHFYAVGRDPAGDAAHQCHGRPGQQPGRGKVRARPVAQGRAAPG